MEGLEGAQEAGKLVRISLVSGKGSSKTSNRCPNTSAGEGLHTAGSSVFTLTD